MLIDQDAHAFCSLGSHNPPLVIGTQQRDWHTQEQKLGWWFWRCRDFAVVVGLSFLVLLLGLQQQRLLSYTPLQFQTWRVIDNKVAYVLVRIQLIQHMTG